jgi:hypothetical protein
MVWSTPRAISLTAIATHQYNEATMSTVDPYDEYDERALELIQSWFKPHLKRPRRLYHYTDANGVLGIISEKRLRLTHAGYLNDPGELKYAANMILETVADEFANRGTILEQFKGWIDKHLDEDALNVPAYVSCFCEKGDLLNQWRGYAGAADGYSIGFDPRHLGDMSWKLPTDRITVLRKVIYDQGKQKAFVKSWTTAICDLIEKTRDKLLPEHTRLYWQTAAELMVTFKSRVYEEEREWRLVEFQRPDSELKFAASRRFIKPYIEYADKSCNLPIREILLGPVLESATARRSLEMLLAKEGFKATVVPSAIKYRP